MLAKQGFPGGFVVGFASLVRAQEVVHECRVVRKTLVGVQIQLQIERCRAVHTLEVVFKVSPVETLDRVARELVEFRVPSVTKIETRELVVPRAVRKVGNSPAIDLFLLLA